MEDRELFNSQKYGDIIEKYKKIDKNSMDMWQLYWLAKSYYKIKEYTRFSQIYNIYIKLNPEKNLLKNLILWSYYHMILCNDNAPEERFYKCAKYILENCIKDENDMLYTATVNKVISHIKNNKVNIDFEMLYEWTGYVNPDRLSQREKIITVDGEEKKTASDKEKWYTNRTKACEETGRYEQCIKLCEEAINIFGPERKISEELNIVVKIQNDFHNNNEMWFKRRIANCKKMLGNIQEAKGIIEDLVLKYQEYILRYDLADICERLGDYELAHRYHYESLLSRSGQIQAKINIIEKIGDILLEEGKPEEAKLHYEFAVSIRKNKGWKVSPSLESKLNSLKRIETNVLPENLFKECRKIWRKNFNEYLPKGSGVIEKLVKNNSIGFIRTDTESIFFNVKNIIDRNKDDILNRNVSFNIIETFDIKKNRKSLEAVNIKLL